ncbi:hypothetical protein B0H14DRAFT_3873419 [Mycena olivaceomarginata]|nr:hypothetical protein B0H14DRAFT_3873419 [Mycena olivaceomarginata]
MASLHLADAVQTLLLCYHRASELFLPPPRPAPPTTELPPLPKAAPLTPSPCPGFPIFGRLIVRRRLLLRKREHQHNNLDGLVHGIFFKSRGGGGGGGAHVRKQA